MTDQTGKPEALSIFITDFQRKRISQGKTVMVLRGGRWIVIKPVAKSKISKIKKQISKLREELLKEKRKRT